MYKSIKHLKNQLDIQLVEIEKSLKIDVLSIIGLIVLGFKYFIKKTIEKVANKKKIAIIYNTSDDIVKIVERMLDIICHNYDEIIFIISNRAMSVGTVFALSGDKIYMDY